MAVGSDPTSRAEKAKHDALRNEKPLDVGAIRNAGPSFRINCTAYQKLGAQYRRRRIVRP